MKMRMRICFLVIGWVGSAWCSKTFFWVNVPFLPASVERQTIAHDQMRNWNVAPRHSFSATVFGGQSASSHKIASYFLPYGKNPLTVGEFNSQATNDHDVDVVAHYFDILTGTPRNEAPQTERDNIFDVIKSWTFESSLGFCPVHTYAGIGLTYRQQLSADLIKGFWLELAMPIMIVKNDLGMHERIITQGGEHGDDPQCSPSFYCQNGQAYHCMVEALKGCCLKYGKIDCDEYKRSKCGIPHIEGRVGYTYVRNPIHHLSSYVGVLLPTGNKPSAEYLFEKIIGNNGQFGIFMGTFGGIKVWEHGSNFYSIEAEICWDLLFPNQQIRSFDLAGKPWSRYIWMYGGSCSSSALRPGINALTKAVNIGHVSLFDINLANVYTTQNFQGELGFHTFVRSQEDIHLAKPWCGGPAVAALWYSNNNFIKTDETRASRSDATISDYRDVSNDVKKFQSERDKGNDAYLPVTCCQLDLASARCPAIAVATVYLGLSYGWYDATYPTVLGIAGGYEFGEGNNVMDRYKLWGKVGVSF